MLKNIILLFISIILFSCENSLEPRIEDIENQLEEIKNYPIHKLSIVNDFFILDTDEVYNGFDFDSQTLWYFNSVSYIDTELSYDVIIELDPNDTTQIRIHTGNNGNTDLYYTNDTSFYEMVEFPTEEDKVNLVIYDRNESDNVYLMIKNQYNRWTKLKLSNLDLLYYGYENYYLHYMYEYYYY
nr:hypothetical protein [Candidatus Neomarinimicrobiota bacterium]